MRPSEKRRSFRIRETVYIKYDVLTDEDFEGGLDRFKLRHGFNDDAQGQLIDIDARLSEAMFMLNGEADNIGRLVTLLNDKLNVVVNLLPGFAKTRAALAKMPAQLCDVGADGLVFSAAQAIPPDTKLHLRFLLESDNRYMETFGRVVRQVESPNDGKDGLGYGIAVEFHGMKPEQREILIQYMFNRESQTLRMRRLEMEKAELER